MNLLTNNPYLVQFDAHSLCLKEFTHYMRSFLNKMLKTRVLQDHAHYEIIIQAKDPPIQTHFEEDEKQQYFDQVDQQQLQKVFKSKADKPTPPFSVFDKTFERTAKSMQKRENFEKTDPMKNEVFEEKRELFELVMSIVNHLKAINVVIEGKDEGFYFGVVKGETFEETPCYTVDIMKQIDFGTPNQEGFSIFTSLFLTLRQLIQAFYDRFIEEYLEGLPLSKSRVIRSRSADKKKKELSKFVNNRKL